MESKFCTVEEVEVDQIIKYDPDVHGSLTIVVCEVDIDREVAEAVYYAGERLPGWGLAMRWTGNGSEELALTKRAARYYHGWTGDLSNEKLVQDPSGSWVFESFYACH